MHPVAMNGRTCVLLLGGAMAVMLASVAAVPFAVLRPSAQDMPMPALVRGLPLRFAEAAPAFRARIAAAFPPGSSEVALIQRLRAEGFDLQSLDIPRAYPADERQANLVRPSSACTLTWHVRWHAERGQIVSASGAYEGVCL